MASCHVKSEQAFNLIFGYADIYGELAENTNLPAASTSVSLSTVPSDEVWVVTNVSMRYIGAGCARILMRASVDGFIVILYQKDTPTSTENYVWGGWLVLGPGDHAELRIIGPAAGEDADITAAGFKMKLTQ